MRSSPALLIALTAMACTTAPLQPAGPVASVQQEIRVDVDHPTDLRWEDATHILLAARTKGLARISLDGAPTEWLPAWPHPRGIGTRYVHLGRSTTHQATADLAFGLRWTAAADNGRVHEYPIEYVADIDVADNRLLVMGLQRNLAGQLGADGATAWIGVLENDPIALRPILPFTNRAAIEACAGFRLSAARFLPGGGFILVPGAEPGVYAYDAEAKLVQTWDSKALRIETDCQLSREEQGLLATDPDARQQWLNARRTVDDIVAFEQSPALLVRSHADGITRWELRMLASETTYPLPITSASPRCHAAADYRDGKLALLLSDSHGTTAPPRLIILTWSHS